MLSEPAGAIGGEVMKPDRKFAPHPSGRPKPKENYRRLSISRPPSEGPLTPGLRQKGMQGPIGFHPSGWKDWMDDE